MPTEVEPVSFDAGGPARRAASRPVANVQEKNTFFSDFKKRDLLPFFEMT